MNPIGPRACYDEGKRVAETLAYAYAKQSKVQVRVARIFNTYGPRMHMNDGRVVSNFILQALQEEPITVSENFVPEKWFHEIFHENWIVLVWVTKCHRLYFTSSE